MNCMINVLIYFLHTLLIRATKALHSFLSQLTIPTLQRMLLEFVPLSDAAKAKGLGKQKDYYYLYFIGTRKDRRGEG